jgi:hypothetical protein
MRNISDRCCRENQNTHFMINNSFSENRAIYEIMWKNMVEPDRPEMTVWCMHIAYWIHKPTNTHSEYVILSSFSLQHGCMNTSHGYVIHTLHVCKFLNIMSCIIFTEFITLLISVYVKEDWKVCAP